MSSKELFEANLCLESSANFGAGLVIRLEHGL